MDGMGDGVKAFRTMLKPDKARTRLALPFDPAVEWGARECYDVTGTVGGVPTRGRLVHEDGAWFLLLGPAWMRDAAIDTAQELDVELSLEGPQRGTLAADVQAALDAEPRALAFFESLPTFYRRNYVRWIEEAKRPETRAARIAQAVTLLRNGRRER